MLVRHQRQRNVIRLALFFVVLLCIQNTCALFDPGESDKGEIHQSSEDHSISQPVPTTSFTVESESVDEKELKGTSPATYVLLDETAPPPPEQLAEAVQAKEYDAWRERIGGEDSDLWLSFDQWRENYLASEREKAEYEKQRLAASRRNRSEKQKDHVKTNYDQGNAQSNSTESIAQKNNSSSSIQPNKQSTDIRMESDSRDNVTERQQSDGDEALITKANADEGSEQIAKNAEVVPSDSINPPDQASIPALGNPTEELANLKQRWNFASLDCAAVVHRSNPGAKFTSSILSEKKDRYMLSPCPTSSVDSQFVVVELCEEIKIDTIVLANFEFFSRMFKRFNVTVSRNLNGGEDEWVDIGSFRARNVRGLQVFKTINPSGDARFFRYIRIDFVEYYGSEYYCPLSLLRVYGLTQMDDYVREEEEFRKAREAETLLLQENEEREGDQANDDALEGAKSVAAAVGESTGSTVMTENAESSSSSTVAEQSTYHSNPSDSTKVERDFHTSSQAQRPIATATNMPDHPSTLIGKSSGDKLLATIDTTPTEKDEGESCANRKNDVFESWRQRSCENNQTFEKKTDLIIETPIGNEQTSIHSDAGSNKAQEKTNRSPSSHTAASPSSVQQPQQPQQPAQHSAHGQQQQQHGGSESIYRTITKRLNILEMNATLSLQYMDHSRHMLRETFGRMERTQQEKIGQMLGELNASNWQQIENLKRRQQMDLQQALFEFDLHRQQTDAERRALLAQVHILSNEIMLEKRFGIAQLALLLGLFVFMGLTRGTRAAAPLINESISRLSRSSSFIPKHGQSHRNGRRQLQNSSKNIAMQSNSSSSSNIQSGSLAKKSKGMEDSNEQKRRLINALSHRSPRSLSTRFFQNHSTASSRRRALIQRQQEEDHGGRQFANYLSTEKSEPVRPNVLNHAVRRPGGINAKKPLRRRSILRPSVMLPKEVPQLNEAEPQWQSANLMSRLIRRSSL